MHIRTRVAALSATLLTAATLIATATPAHAAPANCTGGTKDHAGTSGTAWYICTGGDGGYAFKYRVKHPNPQADTWLYGYQTACVPVPQWLEFRYTWGQREVTGVAFC
ncbi:hypothetical protein C1I98_16580 [Spongiactinospora gelatinilytica]|uniref:Secreted protein n=1 Tax=Spongiactinospora gelatinilytica TaxID=2666298 RepID=A0A2W2I230_9ACTN|nr:hypothetical protein [Spongiactinospora gelatinilytica]PZG44764.1 hypothetical protein C1I98_16580 [Spongiactinospora gelatinilytica]